MLRNLNYLDIVIWHLDYPETLKLKEYIQKKNTSACVHMQKW